MTMTILRLMPAIVPATLHDRIVSKYDKIQFGTSLQIVLCVCLSRRMNTQSVSLRHQIAPCPGGTQSTIAFVIEQTRTCGRAHLTDVSHGENSTVLVSNGTHIPNVFFPLFLYHHKFLTFVGAFCSCESCGHHPSASPMLSTIKVSSVGRPIMCNCGDSSALPPQHLHCNSVVW